MKEKPQAPVPDAALQGGEQQRRWHIGRGWKIALISLASLLGLAVVAVAVACWLLFTPARLTSIVNRLAGDILTCENHFEQVDLTLFRTWPDVGVEVGDVLLVNPYRLPAGNALASHAYQNDTLARVGSVTIGLDLRAFLRDRSIIVRQLRLDDIHANLYTSPDGWNNFDIFHQGDTASADTASSSLSASIRLDKIAVSSLSAHYCNLQQNLLASADGVNIKLKGSWQESVIDADLSLDADSLAVDKRDSLCQPSLSAGLSRLSLSLSAQGMADNLDGKLKLKLPKGRVAVGDKLFTTDAMLTDRHDLLTLSLPFQANLDNKSVTLGDKASVSLLDYSLRLAGDVALANGTEPMRVNLRYAFDDWQAAGLLAILPDFVTKSLKGMDVAAKVSASGTAVGIVASGILPEIDAAVALRKGSFSAPKMLPMPVKDINADLAASLDLSSDTSRKRPSSVDIKSFSAKAKKSTLSVTGRVDDLLEDMLIDARIRGSLSLPDVRTFLPDTMPIALAGSSQLDLKVKSRLSHIAHLNLAQVQADGSLALSQLDVLYDSIHAASPQLKVALRLPQKSAAAKSKSKPKANELIGAHITGGTLNVDMAGQKLAARVEDPDIDLLLPNILDKKQPLAAAFDIRFSKVSAEKDSMIIYSDTLKLKGKVRNDKSQGNPLKQWNPDLDIDILRGVLAMPSMSEAVRMTNFEFNYRPEVCNISRADILWGVSDYHLSGRVYGLEDWLSHKAMLRGDVDFSSQYADIDQLMGILSGMGSDPDTLEQQRAEDNVPREANPFIVPKDVNVRLNTSIGRCVAFDNDLNTLSGSVTVNDGVAILDQIGFTCKAARMQLTGIYKTPRVNNLVVGLDFHLLDIDIDELLDMIPSIDTLVPMLSAFKGNADFHLAVDGSLDAFYRPKMSTLIGAAAISGSNLVVMDNKAVADIAKLLQFKNWREKDNNIEIDSISVEAQLFRKEIVVYPFLLNLHNYQLCIGGRHTLSGSCNYHFELLKCPLPGRLAVDVGGSLSKPQIALGRVQYADLYRPERSNELQTRTLEIKRLVRQALEKNVK